MHLQGRAVVATVSRTFHPKQQQCTTKQHLPPSLRLGSKALHMPPPQAACSRRLEGGMGPRAAFHPVLRAGLRCGIRQHLIPVCGWVVVRPRAAPKSVRPLLCRWALGGGSSLLLLHAHIPFPSPSVERLPFLHGDGLFTWPETS